MNTADIPNEYYDQIVVGDALEVLTALPDSSIDIVITDPPYFLPAEHYAARKKWARSLSDLSIIEHFFGSVFAECRRVLRPTGALVMFCDGQSYPVMYVRAYRTFDRITDLVWDKGQIGMGSGVRRRHELILMAIPASFDWNGWAESVIQCTPIRSEDRIHPAEKPVRLLRQLCKLLGRPGDVVLDPFAGSGNTCIAAKQEGLHYIGVEREADYAQIANRNLAGIRIDPTAMMEQPRLFAV